MEGQQILSYKRANFSTRLPGNHHYTASHFWLKKDDPSGCWRIGFTKFATRMLGEIVECEFDVKDGESIEPGQVIGWVEGFKAASDLYCVIKGKFRGANELLDSDACIIKKDPYVDGWLYNVEGQLDLDVLDVNGYAEVLDQTIDRMKKEAEGT
ncbi:MAG: glycine cleavage system protein H [Verrucomicrobiota bacterium]